jgi:hypothetical protein
LAASFIDPSRRRANPGHRYPWDAAPEQFIAKGFLAGFEIGDPRLNVAELIGQIADGQV